jgi:GT2 family glycosyltransferase
MAQPLVSIVILNWNGAECIDACLQSVIQSTYTNIEIIVVDNGSTDSSVQQIQKYSQVLLVALPQNTGYAAGNNVGFRHVRGKYVVALNNDVVVDSRWLEQPVALFESNARTGIIACRQMNYDNHDIIDCLYAYPGQSLLFEPMGHGQIYKPAYDLHGCSGRVIAANGAAAIYRKTMLDELEGFDESYYAYHEESDLCMRAFLHGWACIYAPQAIVYHRSHFSFNRIKKEYTYYHERNRVWFIYTFFPLKTILQHLPWLIIMELRLMRVHILKRKMGIMFFIARYHGIRGCSRRKNLRKENLALFKIQQQRFRQYQKQKKLLLE